MSNFLLSIARRARSALLVSLMPLLCVLPGCAGTTQLRAGVIFDHPVEYVERPPVRVRRYPRVYYRGYPAYLVRGRWYYASPRGWVRFREEPRELRRYRERRYGTPAPERYRRQRSHDEDRRYRLPRDAERGPIEGPHRYRRR